MIAELTTTDTRNDAPERVATYGFCSECGAPLTMHKITETSSDGVRVYAYTRLLCSVDIRHQLSR